MRAKRELKAFRKRCIDMLYAKNAESAISDVDAIFAHVLGLSWSELQLAVVINGDSEVSVNEYNAILIFIRQREKGHPLQYLLKKTEFAGTTIMLTEGVFIPRPETETLVELACNYIVKYINDPYRFDGIFPLTVYDLCAGSGCIGISVQQRFDDLVEVTLIEHSQPAYECTKRNIATLFPTGSPRPKLLLNDVFAFEPAKHADVILSNPPYIPERVLPTELAYEPKDALFGGGSDGLGFLEKLVPYAHSMLKPTGLFAVEHDETQEYAVNKLFLGCGFSEVVGYMDLNNCPRFTLGVK